MTSRSRRVFAAAAAAAIALPGSAARAENGRSHPPLEMRVAPETAPPPNYLMFWSGVVAFSFAYIDSLFVAAQSDRSTDHALFAPVAGPWIALGNRDCAALACNNEALATTLLIIDGIAQGAGAALIATSFFVEDHPFEIRLGQNGVRVVGRF